MGKKLIYVLNHYSNNSVQHFYHVINLLQLIANEGVAIALVIEKCDDLPTITNKNIKILAQKEKRKIKRVWELFTIISKLIKLENYNKVFIRISTIGAIVSIIAAKMYKAETYYWQSGAAFEIYRALPLFKRVKWYTINYTKFWIIKSYIDYFVTGPESMVDYYVVEAKVERRKIKMLYNDIDVSRFKKASQSEKKIIREKLGLKEDRKYILLVHRFSPVRKTDYYIPYIAESDTLGSAIDFILIGDGPDKEMLYDKILKANLHNVFMLGEKSNSCIQDYYKACDIFINPSYTEGFPRVIIEAMASGLPIIATDAGGTRDLFGEYQQRYVVNKENRELFRSRLVELIENEDIQKMCSIENIERSKRYSTKRVAKMYVNEIWDNSKIKE